MPCCRRSGRSPTSASSRSSLPRPGSSSVSSCPATASCSRRGCSRRSRRSPDSPFRWSSRSASRRPSLGNLTGFLFGRRRRPPAVRSPGLALLQATSTWSPRNASTRSTAARRSSSRASCRSSGRSRRSSPAPASMRHGPLRGLHAWSAACCGVPRLPIAGYELGRSIPDIDRYLLPIVVVIVLISLSPAIIGTIRARRGFDPPTVGHGTAPPPRVAPERPSSRHSPTSTPKA